jgi:CO dehydrogenase/acetyl-CoA synthase beta subunit
MTNMLGIINIRGKSIDRYYVDQIPEIALQLQELTGVDLEPYQNVTEDNARTAAQIDGLIHLICRDQVWRRVPEDIRKNWLLPLVKILWGVPRFWKPDVNPKKYYMPEKS